MGDVSWSLALLIWLASVVAVSPFQIKRRFRGCINLPPIIYKLFCKILVFMKEAGYIRLELSLRYRYKIQDERYKLVAISAAHKMPPYHISGKTTITNFLWNTMSTRNMLRPVHYVSCIFRPVSYIRYPSCHLIWAGLFQEVKSYLFYFYPSWAETRS